MISCGTAERARRTGNAHELLGSRSNKLLLEETGTTTLDTIEVVVYLVGTVKSNVKHNIFRQTVKAHGHQTSLFYDLSALETYIVLAEYLGGSHTFHMPVGMKKIYLESFVGFASIFALMASTP